MRRAAEDSRALQVKRDEWGDEDHDDEWPYVDPPKSKCPKCTAVLICAVCESEDEDFFEMGELEVEDDGEACDCD